MKKPNRTLMALTALGLTLVLALGFTGCKGKPEGAADTTEQPDQVIALRFAGQDPPDHPNTQRLNHLKEAVEQATDGRIQITVYPANELGDFMQVYEAIMAGTIDGGLINVAGASDPRLDFIYTPYLVADYEEAGEIFGLDGPVGHEVAILHEGLGVKFLGFAMAGFGGIATMDAMQDYQVPGADKGIRLRVPPTEVHKVYADDAGFLPVVLSYTQLRAALESGRCTGTMGLTASDCYFVLKDRVKYFYPYNNLVDNKSMVMNLNTFNALTPEDQQLFLDICAEISAQSTQEAAEHDAYYRDKLKEAGVTVVEMTHEEIEGLAAETRSESWPKYDHIWGATLSDTLKEILNALNEH